MKTTKSEKNWCGCPTIEGCKGHTMQVEIDGKIQPHLNALDVLKYALDVKMGKVKPGQEIEN